PERSAETLSAIEVNARWWSYRKNRPIKSAWRSYRLEAQSYLHGLCRVLRIAAPDWVMLPTGQSVAVVITAMNEADTLGPLLKQMRRLPLSEKIVVINGSSDDSFTMAHDEGATVIYYPEALGHDVGRAVGARLT